jgi:hypothetical protein
MRRAEIELHFDSDNLYGNPDVAPSAAFLRYEVANRGRATIPM